MVEAKIIQLHEIKHSHFFVSYFESGARRVQPKELEPTDRQEIFPPGVNPVKDVHDGPCEITNFLLPVI